MKLELCESIIDELIFIGDYGIRGNMLPAEKIPVVIADLLYHIHVLEEEKEELHRALTNDYDPENEVPLIYEA